MKENNHIDNHTGRPIVSANGHPTEKNSQFVDFHLRLHIEALSSHLKDTADYLQNFLRGPLYISIPHNYGIEACRETWDQITVKEPPTECLVQLVTLVLMHNNFTFNGEHI